MLIIFPLPALTERDRRQPLLHNLCRTPIYPHLPLNTSSLGQGDQSIPVVDLSSFFVSQGLTRETPPLNATTPSPIYSMYIKKMSQDVRLIWHITLIPNNADLRCSLPPSQDVGWLVRHGGETGCACRSETNM